MKIGFDAKRYFNNQTGLGNYSRWLVDSLVSNDSNDYCLYSSKPNTHKHIPVLTPRGFGSILKSLWRVKFIINDLVKDKIDVYHGLSNELPFGIHKTNIKTVVTIHDLINLRYPEYYNGIDRLIYKRKLEYAQHVADRIIVPSYQTKKDLIQFFHTNEDKIQVIPLSIPIVKDNQSTESVHDKAFVLCVSGFSKRKNLVKLVKAYTQIDTPFDLIIAGRKGDSYNDVVNEVGYAENIKLMTDVSLQTLGLLYKNSEYCVYPSEYEGFGIPILEAFSYGKTVATSNISSMPEVGGNAAEYFDPQSVDSIKDSILQLNDLEYRATKETEILTQLNKFESITIIEQYENMYKSLLLHKNRNDHGVTHFEK